MTTRAVVGKARSAPRAQPPATGSMIAWHRRRTASARWAVSLAATAASTYALDAIAASTGLLLVASGLLDGFDRTAVMTVLGVSYVCWALALRTNLQANWALLQATGTSTNVLSKAAHDLAHRRSGDPRITRLAAGAGYTATELAKEIPYYASAFGAVALTDTVTTRDALVFLAGANLGAALYEYGLARLTGALLSVRALRRRHRHASFDTDWVPREYLADYYRSVEPDERATIAFLVEALRRAERGRPVLFFGVGPTLHHVFAAAEVASELHLGDYLTANLDEIRRWLERRPGAHDWRPFVRYTLECEGVCDPSEAQVTAREELTRQRITRLVQVDARHPRPVEQQYATVVSAYCADSATDDRATWQRFMRHITGLVEPGGLFVTAALRRCRSYAVGGKAFPCADIDEDDLRAVLHPDFASAVPDGNGRSSLDGRIEVCQVAQDDTHGYGAIVLAHARKAGGRRPSSSAVPAAPPVVGAGIRVPLVTGGERRYVNLDYAASAPSLVAVHRAVTDLLPWYSSVHRGAGWTSRLTTDAYEGAREAVHGFVGARRDDVVVFTRNTTDATNLLASALPPDAEVFAFAVEHHANLLPWRRRRLTLLPVPQSPDDAVASLDSALAARPARGPRLVSVTGASNVTGEVWPVAALARVAHAYGARIMVDAAQLAPHRQIDMAADEVDYLALSGHKLYAPFGSGALIGAGDWLEAREPFLAGGGAVRYVGTDNVLWADLPDRQEAGSPNVVGAVALGVACQTLQTVDREALEAHQAGLVDQARDRLAAVPGVRMLRLWDAAHPRIGVLPFTLDGVPYAQLAAVLSAEHAIGVRHGCFCAHRLMATLLGLTTAQDDAIGDGLARGVPTAVPGAVRASIGLGTTAADLDRLVQAVTDLVANGPRWTYTSSPDGTDCVPTPDPRRYPSVPFKIATGVTEHWSHR